MAAVDVVIMAAGKGTRMKSQRPKVLHTLSGRALLTHVLDAAVGLSPRRTVVITGHGADQVEAASASHPAAPRYMRQMPQLGTGHAVQQAVPVLDDDSATVLILNGDVPLIEAATLRGLVEACDGRHLALLTCVSDDATGYGRILRDAAGRVQGIVEHKDATPEQRTIREWYTGVMAAPAGALKRWLAALRNDNAQGEYYLTDVVAMAVAQGLDVRTAHPAQEREVLGVNDLRQLAALERSHQQAQAERLMLAGVRLADPARFDLRGELVCGTDVEIDINCVFEGRVVLGDGVRVGAHSVLRDTTVAAGAVIHPFCHLEGAQVGAGALIGPYARLRPGAELGEQVHIGNFVEVKNSTLARGAKANHLAYLGDATVGEDVNYGAGSITANYDGAHKHRTVIGARVHVGSNSVLVAPVTVGDDATVGAGSVITRDTPPGALAVTRASQRHVDGWKRHKKKPSA